MNRPRIVILASSLLNDRMILYNNFLKTLSKEADVTLWPTAWQNEAYSSLNIPNVKVEQFPVVKPMKYTLQMLRRLNDYSWDEKKLTKSREMFRRLNGSKEDFSLKMIRGVSRVVHALRLESKLEKVSEPLYIKETRSAEAYERLKSLKPDVLVCMSSFRQDEPGIVASARKLHIPVINFITSWDNITTKNRFMFQYDGYLVWSESMKNDLYRLYPQAIGKPCYIVGAPQYDIFVSGKYDQTKEEFCKENGLDPNLPIVLYTLGSPNLFDEFPGAVEFLKRAAKNEMGNIQVIVRAHPLHHNDPEVPKLTQYYDKTLIQMSNPKKGDKHHTHDEYAIIEWVNTFKHSDVVINIGSTVAIDASFYDSPVINLNFDPSGKKDELVKSLNHVSDHYTPITNSGGMWEVQNYDELIKAVKGYIQNPALHCEGRKRIIKHVCEFTDGKSGERFAQALIHFTKHQD